MAGLNSAAKERLQTHGVGPRGALARTQNFRRAYSHSEWTVIVVPIREKDLSFPFVGTPLLRDLLQLYWPRAKQSIWRDWYSVYVYPSGARTPLGTEDK